MGNGVDTLELQYDTLLKTLKKTLDKRVGKTTGKCSL